MKVVLVQSNGVEIDEIDEISVPCIPMVGDEISLKDMTRYRVTKRLFDAVYAEADVQLTVELVYRSRCIKSDR